MAVADTESSLSGRDAQLASLVKHAAWPEFLAALDDLIDAETMRLARDAMLRESGGIGEGELQHHRGVVHGIRQAVKVAHTARARFDKEEK